MPDTTINLPAIAPAPTASLPPRYGPPIPLLMAARVMAAAESEAARQQWPMVIAIVGSSGHLVMLHAMDHAQHGSLAIAQAKAETAVNFRRATKLVEDAVAGGGLGLRMLSLNNVCAVDGGLPLIVNGEVVGAIGVSGMLATQDAQVAAAGSAAL
ncbi:MAG TPA: heme-binding protein [Rhodocyclaceae bacterium]|nr:heme-binding protein [Rhodocyclaceae bacterium]